jgi:hypothetical protein
MDGIQLILPGLDMLYQSELGILPRDSERKEVHSLNL